MHLAVGGGGELHLVGDVARGHALEKLGEDSIGVLEALGVLSLAHLVVALLVLLRAQLAPAEVVDEVDLRSKPCLRYLQMHKAAMSLTETPLQRRLAGRPLI